MQNSGFTTIDAIIALVYVLSIIGIGVYLYNKQKSTKDFLLAGRSMGWFSIGLTLMATLTSAVGYMAYPAGAFKYGLIMLWMAMAIPISYPLVVFVFMPFYHRLRVYTAYEYLERRFNTNVRALASAIFILWRLTWMAAVVYVPSMVLNVVTNGKIPLIPSIFNTWSNNYSHYGHGRNESNYVVECNPLVRDVRRYDTGGDIDLYFCAGRLFGGMGNAGGGRKDYNDRVDARLSKRRIFRKD